MPKINQKNTTKVLGNRLENATKWAKKWRHKLGPPKNGKKAPKLTFKIEKNDPKKMLFKNGGKKVPKKRPQEGRRMRSK